MTTNTAANTNNMINRHETVLQIVASKCAVCGRDLTDSKSVELGIGPICRGKYNFNKEVTEAERALCNQLVYRAAVARSNRSEGWRSTVIVTADHLLTMGFEELANAMAKGVAKIKITTDGKVWMVKSPYNPDTAYAWRKIATWDPKAKVRCVPFFMKRRLWNFLKEHFAGELGWGTKGYFKI